MRSALKTLFLVLCIAVIASPAMSTPEFRGLYVDAWHPGFKTHEEVTQMVSSAKEGNFNALIVQVRKRGDAYYNSRLEPKALDIAADYDPLADIVQQAHAAGIQVHAWVTVYEIALDSNPAAKKQMCLAHPEWLMAKPDGATSFNNGKVFFDPGVPAVQDHIVSLVADIAKNYAVDGIHLEGARYMGREGGYNPSSVARFQEETGTSEIPDNFDLKWCDWRRSQITGLVGKIRDKLAEVRPGCVLSASVLMPSPALASMVCMQDWEKWMKDGMIDFAIPMLYVTSETTLTEATDLLQFKYGRHMYIGVGNFQLSSSIARQQIADALSAGAEGTVLFSYHYLVADTENPDPLRISNLRTSVFAQPAATPPMPWHNGDGK